MTPHRTRTDRPLAAHHRAVLEQGSAIAPDVILERGYWTAYSWQDLDGLSFSGPQKARERFPALVIPQHDPSGAETYSVLRPDCPRILRGREVKYEQPAGVGLRLDVPLHCVTGLRENAHTLWFTEGAKKVDALASLGLVAVNTPGVDGWRSPNAIPDLYGIPLKERSVVVGYDSDLLLKPAVCAAVLALARWVRQKGARVEVLDWRRTDMSAGAKVGVDDFLAAGRTRAELEALRTPLDEWLASAAMDEPRVTNLAAGPPTLTRPLGLVDNDAYAVT
jgi:putative DNA primase/helicase